ncbi:MAG: ATP-binding cassette domain-containing protein [Clostridia bacterium]|nr:ATP-binding cassette domain-containing protein [Clostridia bacterium]
MKEAVVELKDATLAYNKDYCALNCVSLVLNQGDRIAIEGEYGCGKTSFLRVIANLEQLKSGECLLNGRAVTQVDFAHDISLGFLSRDPVFFEYRTVKSNLEWVLKSRGIVKEEREGIIMRTLEECDLVSLVNKKIRWLSKVEKRLVQIARLLLRPIDVLLCDEILEEFDTVDQNSIISILKLVLKKSSNCVVVFACTNAKLYQEFSPKLYYLKYGVLSKHGESDEADIQ